MELAIVEKIFCKVLPLFLFISVFFSIFAHHIENHSIFCDYYYRSEYINQLKDEDMELARDVFDTLGKDFFESSKKEVQVEFPPLNLDREQIIREYQTQQAQEARQQHIDSLFQDFYSKFEMDNEDEKAAFEKKANDLLVGAKDEQIDALF